MQLQKNLMTCSKLLAKKCTMLKHNKGNAQPNAEPQANNQGNDGKDTVTDVDFEEVK